MKPRSDLPDTAELLSPWWKHLIHGQQRVTSGDEEADDGRESTNES